MSRPVGRPSAMNRRVLMALPLVILAGRAVAGAARSPVVPACRAAQLRLSIDGRDGDFDGMSHSGTELSIRNLGPDCTMPARPSIDLRDARGRVLPVRARAGTDGPLSVRIARGDRAAADLRWVSGPVFPRNRRLRVAGLTLAIGGARLRVPLAAIVYGPAGQRASFDRTSFKRS